MADSHFTVAHTGGTNADALTSDIIAAISKIAVSVNGELGQEGIDAALDKAFELLDDSNPSVSDLQPLADAVGADISDLLDDDGAGSGSGAGDDAAAASANGSVSLTANTRKVANPHGLPTDWHALDGIDLPPSLADATLNDRGLAAAINKANGWDPAEGEGVTARRIANVRDKDLDGEPGASLTALNDDDAGPRTDLDAEPPLPASTVRQRVEAHLSKTGRDTGLNSGDGFGASIEDLDGE